MDEDLRDRFKSRPDPEPAKRAVPVQTRRPSVTDGLVATPVPAVPAPASLPQARTEPAPEPIPTAEPVVQQVELPPEPEPQPEPKVPREPEPKTPKAKRPKRKKPYVVAITVVLLVLLLAGGSYFVFSSKQAKTKASQAAAAKAPTFPGINFPIYYPTNLPSGYSFNKDFKVLKDNVLYYSVTDPAGNNYYVTLQPIPTSFNFSAFNAKFNKPAQFSTNVGSVVAGQAGANYIGSIQTSNNVWIIINTDAKNVQSSLETITRSFEAAK